MQNHKWLWYLEAVCPVCYQKFQYMEGTEQPPTCGEIECLKKHYLKGMGKFMEAIK